jgi:hypothetical protein
MSFNADDSAGIANQVVADNPVGSDDLVVADGASATMSTKPNIRAAIQTVFKVRKTIGILLGQGTSLRGGSGPS